MVWPVLRAHSRLIRRILLYSLVHSSSASACTNGLAISSLPSTGLMRTSNVPLATSRPRFLVLVLPSSSNRTASQLMSCGLIITPAHLSSSP